MSDHEHSHSHGPNDHSHSHGPGADDHSHSHSHSHSHGPGDAAICQEHYAQVATVDARPITRSTPFHELPRCTWPGPLRHALQRRRWLLTGHL